MMIYTFSEVLYDDLSTGVLIVDILLWKYIPYLTGGSHSAQNVASICAITDKSFFTMYDYRGATLHYYVASSSLVSLSLYMLMR